MAPDRLLPRPAHLLHVQVLRGRQGLPLRRHGHRGKPPWDVLPQRRATVSPTDRTRRINLNFELVSQTDRFHGRRAHPCDLPAAGDRRDGRRGEEDGGRGRAGQEEDHRVRREEQRRGEYEIFK